MGLYHFDESVDTVLFDDSFYPENLKAHGAIRRASVNGPPFYSDLSPFLCNGTVINSGDSGNFSLRDLINCSTSGSKIYLSKSLVNQPVQLTDRISISGNIEIINLNYQPVIIIQKHESNPVFNISNGSKLSLYNIHIKRSFLNNNTLINNQGVLVADKVSIKNN